MSTPAIDFSHFDPAVRPVDDLFGHVNGTWAAQAEIPIDRSSWGAFHELRENSDKAVHEIIEGVTPDESPDAARIANLYASFMDVDTIEARGLEPIKPLMDRVDAITSMPELARHLGWALRHGISGVFDFEHESDPGDPSRYVMFVGQDGLGLPDEEYYRADQHAEILLAYRKHVATMFELFELDDPAGQADATVNLEVEIAKAHWDKVRIRDMVAMYHPQSWQEFVAETPQLHWEEFLAGAELPESCLGTIVNAQRTFPAGIAELFTEDRLEQWKSWARWNVINDMANFLPEAIVQQDFNFYGKTLQGVPELRVRWKRGVSLVQGVLGEAVGRIYAERHFPAEVKARADELVAHLLEAYRESITNLDWMSDATKAEALDKLSKFRPKIGYPNVWRDYSALELVSDDLAGNVLRASSFELDHMIDELSKPIDPETWLMFPQTVNAYYHPLRNEIVFPAAILQPPFFNADADDAVNYGAIGGVIGHEIGHGFDDQGSTCDGDGRLRNWWTDEDRAAFEERTAALVAQYDVLSPTAAPDVTVNGELTLGENIGDLGGLAIAYQAWKAATADQELEDIDGYTPEQRFFIGWAQTWRTITRSQAMRERIATDPHSPDEIRCNQVARNLPAFHEAFGTTHSDDMWLAEDQRVSIW